MKRILCAVLSIASTFVVFGFIFEEEYLLQWIMQTENVHLVRYAQQNKSLLQETGIASDIEKTTLTWLEIEQQHLNDIYKENEQQLSSYLNNITEEKVIVWWNPPYWLKKGDSKTSGDCGPCTITTDKQKINETTTKGVIFHQDIDLNNLPPKRRDSDIFYPYDTAVEVVWSIRNINPVFNIDDFLKNKTRLGVWIVSNCGATPGANVRKKLIEEMIQNGFEIDRRGKCYPENPPVPSENMLKFISQYKFYMAFENNYHCKDYVTEKFFRNGLQSGSVPVVWGSRKIDYQREAPPNSFIHVEDFKSIALLVDYLKYLDKNDTAYKQYLAWRHLKRNDFPYRNRKHGICQLCRIMHGINIDNIWNPTFNTSHSQSQIPLFGYPAKPRFLASLADWYYGSNKDDCQG